MTAHCVIGANIIVFICLEKFTTHRELAVWGFSFLMLDNVVRSHVRGFKLLRRRRRISPELRAQLSEEIVRLEAKLARYS
jgi:hypothetical protein